ncbi:nucleotidyltransferase family protein [Candidatus Poriferisocius sp.]|uniref:nucleotidyltransferase family protein n=1 Tax=Candidatus Poriferisocius sp. TaxID=3101276 RepID=UPI003B5A8426
MTRRDAILGIHRGTILDVARRHHATSISLVGSTARGEDTENSDCDFLADFAPGTTYFNLSDLAAELRALLGCEIDIIPSQGLKPRKRHRILEDAITL